MRSDFFQLKDEKRARAALLDSLAVSRGGARTRAVVLTLCTLPVIAILGAPQLLLWLAALLVWDGVAIKTLERRWVLPVLEHDLLAARLRRTAMVFFGFCLTQGLPLTAWSVGGVFGAIVGVSWVMSAATQLFVYYSRDRLMLAGGMLPVIACALIGPSLSNGGVTIESIISALFILFALAVGAAFVGRSDRLIAQAEASSQAKSRFIAGIHHELRTPLNAIIGYSEMLRESAEENSRAGDVADLDRVIAAARLQLMLMNDLLAFSELQDGAVELELDAFDAAAFARESAHALRHELSANGNHFRLVVDGEIGVVRSDAAKLRQCLQHLLTNAAKFTRSGQITLEVRRQRTRSGDWLLFKVSDTGAGIAPERMPRLFEPLAHAENSVERRTSAGFGLAITARLARLLGGEVSVESAAGAGSAFTLRVRADLDTAQSASAATAKSA
jgi:signal transduction histidine kinase